RDARAAVTRTTVLINGFIGGAFLVSRRNLPTGTIGFFQVLVRFRRVATLHRLRVPRKFFPDAHRDQSEQADFGQRGTVFKVGPRRRTPFTRVEPFAVMTFRACEAWRGTLVVFVFGAGKQFGPTAP